MASCECSITTGFSAGWPCCTAAPRARRPSRYRPRSGRGRRPRRSAMSTRILSAALLLVLVAPQAIARERGEGSGPLPTAGTDVGNRGLLPFAVDPAMVLDEEGRRALRALEDRFAGEFLELRTRQARARSDLLARDGRRACPGSRGRTAGTARRSDRGGRGASGRRSGAFVGGVARGVGGPGRGPHGPAPGRSRRPSPDRSRGRSARLRSGRIGGANGPPGAGPAPRGRRAADRRRRGRARRRRGTGGARDAARPVVGRRR